MNEIFCMKKKFLLSKYLDFCVFGESTTNCKICDVIMDISVHQVTYIQLVLSSIVTTENMLQIAL